MVRGTKQMVHSSLNPFGTGQCTGSRPGKHVQEYLNDGEYSFMSQCLADGAQWMMLST